MIIFKNCVNTIREVGNWKWKKIKLTEEKNAPDEPMGKDDHTCDCLRYMIMSRPNESIMNQAKDLSIISPLYKMQELKRRREEARV